MDWNIAVLASGKILVFHSVRRNDFRERVVDRMMDMIRCSSSTEFELVVCSATLKDNCARCNCALVKRHNLTQRGALFVLKNRIEFKTPTVSWDVRSYWPRILA